MAMPPPGCPHARAGAAPHRRATAQVDLAELARRQPVLQVHHKLLVVFIFAEVWQRHFGRGGGRGPPVPQSLDAGLARGGCGGLRGSRLGLLGAQVLYREPVGPEDDPDALGVVPRLGGLASRSRGIQRHTHGVRLGAKCAAGSRPGLGLSPLVRLIPRVAEDVGHKVALRKARCRRLRLHAVRVRRRLRGPASLGCVEQGHRRLQIVPRGRHHLLSGGLVSARHLHKGCRRVGHGCHLARAHQLISVRDI
eukprot:scaffold10425_cov114-Isochrysis_galbana.AAC.1